MVGDHTIVSGSADNTVRVWRLSDGALLRTLEGHSSFVYSVAVIGDHTIVSGSGDKTVRVWGQPPNADTGTAGGASASADGMAGRETVAEASSSVAITSASLPPNQDAIDVEAEGLSPPKLSAAAVERNERHAKRAPQQQAAANEQQKERRAAQDAQAEQAAQAEQITRIKQEVDDEVSFVGGVFNLTGEAVDAPPPRFTEDDQWGACVA